MSAAGLPPRVYAKHGRYYYVTRPDRRWVPLTRVSDGIPAALRALAGLLSADLTGDPKMAEVHIRGKTRRVATTAPLARKQ